MLSDRRLSKKDAKFEDRASVHLLNNEYSVVPDEKKCHRTLQGFFDFKHCRLFWDSYAIEVSSKVLVGADSVIILWLQTRCSQ